MKMHNGSIIISLNLGHFSSSLLYKTHLSCCPEPSLLEPLASGKAAGDPDFHAFIDSQRVTPAGAGGLKGSCLNLSQTRSFSWL